MKYFHIRLLLYLTQAELSVEISISLIGLMALWLGFFKIAEQAGLADAIANTLTPFFRKLMPELPEKHPAIASMTMNMGANALGLDNAATPFGIKAMHDLQSSNHSSNTLSNAQILFLVLKYFICHRTPRNCFFVSRSTGSLAPH